MIEKVNADSENYRNKTVCYSLMRITSLKNYRTCTYYILTLEDSLVGNRLLSLNRYGEPLHIENEAEFSV